MLWDLLLMLILNFIFATVVVQCFIRCSCRSRFCRIGGKFLPQLNMGECDAYLRKRYENTVLQFSRSGKITCYDLKSENPDKDAIIGTYTATREEKIRTEKVYRITCEWDTDKYNSAARDLSYSLYYVPKSKTIMYYSFLSKGFFWTREA